MVLENLEVTVIILENAHIVELEKQAYKRFPLHFHYSTRSYYDIIQEPEEVFSIHLVKKPFASEIQKCFTGHLYDDHLENPTAFALIHDEQTIGYLEIDRYEWNNRLRVTELLILPEFRGRVLAPC